MAMVSAPDAAARAASKAALCLIADRSMTTSARAGGTVITPDSFPYAQLRQARPAGGREHMQLVGPDPQVQCVAHGRRRARVDAGDHIRLPVLGACLDERAV